MAKRPSLISSISITDSAYCTGSMAPRRPSIARSNSEMKLDEDIDYFELFCAQAGRRGSRRLSRADEFGGSLPCLGNDLEPGINITVPSIFLPKEEDDGQLKRKHLSLHYTCSLPTSRFKRKSAGTGQNDGKPGSLSPCFGEDSPCQSPNRSPCRSPSRSGSLRKSRSGKLWSSIKNLLESCSEASLDCMDPSSPPPRCRSRSPECRSAPHSRSSSVKRPKKPRNQELAYGEIRPRTSSVPSRSCLKRPTTLSIDSKNVERRSLSAQTPEDACRIRNFVITPKGFINRGDSFRSRSANSVFSLGSGGSDDGNDSFGSFGSLDTPSTHRILMMGASGVGKTTMSQQFLTSESINVEMVDEEKSTTTVRILLDGEESTLECIDMQDGENHRDFLDIDAYMVMFSTSDRNSFHLALDLIYDLRKHLNKSDAIILVANKIDLVRVRQVAPEEGKSAAVTYDCKYVEVSALMNLHVDELLAGALTQIKLHRRSSSDVTRRRTDDGCRSTMTFIGRFLKRQGTISRSCDNLLVV